MSEEMETREVTFTEEDLSGDTMDPFDCPGYRAIKRVIPTLESWAFEGGIALEPITNKAVVIRIPSDVGDKLMCHSYYQTKENSGLPEYPPTKLNPFSCLITAPKQLFSEKVE